MIVQDAKMTRVASVESMRKLCLPVSLAGVSTQRKKQPLCG